jgi:hypothetical protein
MKGFLSTLVLVGDVVCGESDGGLMNAKLKVCFSHKSHWILIKKNLLAT